jgi:molybdopterin-guanine dinucleotide biosynthesis protein A
MLKVGGIVLCGGRSRRMGRSKVWLACGGEHLLQRVIRIVGEAVCPVVVGARPRQHLPALPDDVLVVRDKLKDAGPLAGVAAGFDALAEGCDAAFVVSCDHPLLKASFIVRLIELLCDHPAAVPQHEGRLYPLTAVYRLDTRATLADLLAAGELRAHQFAKACGGRIVTAADLCAADPDLDSLMNVNDPAAYERVKEVRP